MYTDRRFILGLIVIALSIILIAMSIANAHAETYNYTLTDLFNGPINLQVGDSINVFNNVVNTQYVYANESQNMVNTGLLHPNQTANLHFMYNGTWDMRNVFNNAEHTTVNVGGSFAVMQEPTLQFDQSNATQIITQESNSTQPIVSAPVTNFAIITPNETSTSTDKLNFTDSNGTQLSFQSSNSTQPPSQLNQSSVTNDTVQYWKQQYQTAKSQADYWQNMYESLLNTLRSLIGGL